MDRKIYFDSYVESYKDINILIFSGDNHINFTVDNVLIVEDNSKNPSIIVNNKHDFLNDLIVNNLKVKICIPNTENYYEFVILSKVSHATNDGYITFINVENSGKLVFDGKDLPGLDFALYKNSEKDKLISDELLSKIDILYEKQKEPSYFNPEQFQKKKNYSKRKIFKTSYEKKEEKDKDKLNKNKVFNSESVKISYGEKDKDILSSILQNDIDSMIGLTNIKEEIEKIYKVHDFIEKRKTLGIDSDDISSKHMVFSGPPGTGKTTVARIMASIFYLAGDIPENKCVEVTGNDLQPNYVGQASDLVNGIVDVANGGVLFIDEAYSLMNSAFSEEAVSILLKRMEDDRDDMIVIFAGYENDINKMLDINEGFKSRVNTMLSFESYKIDELAELLFMFLKQHHLFISRKTLDKCMTYLSGELSKPDFANGRTVRNLVEKLEANHANNIYKKDINEGFLLDLIVPSDF